MYRELEELTFDWVWGQNRTATTATPLYTKPEFCNIAHQPSFRVKIQAFFPAGTVVNLSHIVSPIYANLLTNICCPLWLVTSGIMDLKKKIHSCMVISTFLHTFLWSVVSYTLPANRCVKHQLFPGTEARHPKTDVVLVNSSKSKMNDRVGSARERWENRDFSFLQGRGGRIHLKLCIGLRTPVGITLKL